MSEESSSTGDFPPPLKVKDYPWGCVYTGTRIQIIAARLIPLKCWPSFPKGQDTFEGHWEIGGKRRKVTIERNYCPSDTESGDIWVRYTQDELSPFDAVDQATEKLAALHAEIIRIVAALRPQSLSAILGIEALREEPGQAVLNPEIA